MPLTNLKQHNSACAAHQLVARRIADLIRERAILEEEVSQLRVAVQIWTAVVEQTAAPAGADRCGNQYGR